MNIGRLSWQALLSMKLTNKIQIEILTASTNFSVQGACFEDAGIWLCLFTWFCINLTSEVETQNIDQQLIRSFILKTRCSVEMILRNSVRKKLPMSFCSVCCLQIRFSRNGNSWSSIYWVNISPHLITKNTNIINYDYSDKM